MSSPESYPLPIDLPEDKVEVHPKDPHLDEDEFNDAIEANRKRRHLRPVDTTPKLREWEASDEEKEAGLRMAAEARANIASAKGPILKPTISPPTPQEPDFGPDGLPTEEYYRRAQ